MQGESGPARQTAIKQQINTKIKTRTNRNTKRTDDKHQTTYDVKQQRKRHAKMNIKQSAKSKPNQTPNWTPKTQTKKTLTNFKANTKTNTKANTHWLLWTRGWVVTCSMWKRNSLCTWRVSFLHGGLGNVSSDSACNLNWTHRIHRLGWRQGGSVLPMSLPLSMVRGQGKLTRGWVGPGFVMPAGNDLTAAEHLVAPNMPQNLRER